MRSLLVLSVLLFASTIAHAAKFGLVVGINDYQYGHDEVMHGRIRNLEGAENDATLIAQSLRKIEVSLPSSRVLIGSNATLAAFKTAWSDMLKQSLPGDVLIVTFAGHGGQEQEVSAPIDESKIDGLDETLMFWDFDPAQPRKGRLVDDELFTLFKNAGDRQIIFVADSCHSAGLTRDIDVERGRSRQGGTYAAPDSLDGLIELEAVEGENWDLLTHVTYLTATDNEAFAITEIPYKNKPHGALSVSFAEGIEGRADSNGDGRVLRRELQEYVQTRVRTLADQRQTPGFSPRSGATAEIELLSLANFSTATQTANDVSQDLAVTVTGGLLPDGVLGAVQADKAALRFEYVGSEVISYYNNDELLRWLQSEAAVSNRARQRWQLLIDKFRYLNAVDLSYNLEQPALKLTTNCTPQPNTTCDREHRLGEIISFEFDHLRSGNGKYFVLFNLAGNGKVQMLYPIEKADKAQLSSLPYSLELRVSTPVGRDDLVSVFCKKDPVNLKNSLQSAKHAPDPVKFNEHVIAADCQVNRMAVFTAH